MIHLLLAPVIAEHLRQEIPGDCTEITARQDYKSLYEVLDTTRRFEKAVNFTWVAAHDVANMNISGPFRFGYGQRGGSDPIGAARDLNMGVGSPPVEADILGLVGRSLAAAGHPVHYLEIGASVGKTFSLVTAALPPKSSVYILTLERANPTILRNLGIHEKLKSASQQSWTSGSYSLLKSSPNYYPGLVDQCGGTEEEWGKVHVGKGGGFDRRSTATVTDEDRKWREGFLPFTSDVMHLENKCGVKQFSYVHGSVLDENAWTHLQKAAGDATFNVIFSDACHVGNAVKFECEVVVKKKLVDFSKPFFYAWDDGFLNEYCTRLFTEAAGNNLTSGNIMVNGWRGENEFSHKMGIVTNVDTKFLRSELAKHNLIYDIMLPNGQMIIGGWERPTRIK